MKNVPCVCDFRPLLFAEQFERLSRLALVSVYAIALNKFWKSCEESYNNRVDDPRLDSRPPYLWQWMDDSDILIGNKVYRKPSFKPFLHLRDSEIKKITNQFNRYKYEKESIASVRQEAVV